MKNSRLTFNSSTNFTLPIGAYQILQWDANYYGYAKNGNPNISGFLNDLLPVLSDYQEDLRQELLKYNNGNADIVKKIARSIHNVYLRPFTFHDDGVVNVPFRISQDKYNDFTLIHDEYLRFYDTDFTNYIRTLLVEYSSKTFAQREYLCAFQRLKTVREGITKSIFCKFLCDGKYDIFVPVSIETSPIYGHNYIVGITSEIQPISIRLRDLQKTIILDDRIKITEEICDLITEHLDKLYEEEYSECSD